MTSPTALPTNLDQALDAYKAGETVAKCAAIVGVSRQTFRKYVRDAGLPLRHQAADPDALNGAIEAYIGGQTLEQCANMCSIGHETFRQHLLRLDIPRRDQVAANGRRIPTPEGLVDDFVGGMSTKATAAKYGIDRHVVNRMLKEVGISSRNRSDALQLRWRRASAEDRRAMLDNAHAATRGLPLSDERREALAAGRAGIPRSPLETALGALLAELGYSVAYGVPCGPYNIDIVIAGTVAVEVNGGHWHEVGYHRAAFGERSRNILNAGYSLAIVWVQQSSYPIDVRCAQHLGTLAQIARGNPAIGRQHWVIRGNGHFLAVREDDGDEVPFINAAGRRDR